MFSTEQQNNKRIAKNTLLLYFRMMLTMIVSLYTSRVVLQTLGVENFGIYNVVGGVVAMFTMLSGSLSAAISRFLTFELGRDNEDKLKSVFSSAVSIQLMLCMVVILLTETVGLWFLNSKMNIPAERLSAANWVLQLASVTFCVNLISVPYNAAIIAHEKMSAFAYVSVFEVVCKLAVAWAILFSPVDRLIFYSILMTVVALCVRFVYGWYCKRHFNECTCRFIFDKKLLRQMFCFAGWNFFGAGSYQLMTQGVNVLANMSFGVMVNAARGIATQVDSAIMQFVNNFTTAINPQITKSYATGNKEYLYKLIYSGAKYSYFLMMIFTVPLFFETDLVLTLWLKNVPEHAANFVRLSIILSMIHVLSNSMITAMLATGNIKKYQIIVGGLGMLVFPLSFVAFKFGFPAETAYVINILVFLLQLGCRLHLMKNMIGMSVLGYVKSVLIKVFLVTFAVVLLTSVVWGVQEASFVRFISVVVCSFVASSLAIFFLGFVKNERDFVVQKIHASLGRIKLS